MITRYGMSEALGPATFEGSRMAPYLPEPSSATRSDYSEQTAEVIDQEVHKLLTAAQERVHGTLKTRQAELAALAQALLSQEVVDRATLLGILSAQGSQASVVADSQNTQEAALLDPARKADVRVPPSAFPT
jgi:cell division protease FtsH